MDSMFAEDIKKLTKENGAHRQTVIMNGPARGDVGEQGLKIFTYIKILAIAGIVLAIYLLWQQLFRPAFQPCYVNSFINCDAVISGAVAKTFGLPTPLYGLIGYIVIFFAAILQKKKLLISMATFGLVFCLWIGYKELFQLRVICPVCIMCQLIMISIFSLAIYLKRMLWEHIMKPEAEI